ncbi:hypothetical protein [Jannaschia rubra]|uniref:Uncharacterized protein n=1 Tax=Jannaschia rubra TaxID=282197 RepID=A0A0M6XVE6_9RHOB|nr:hypothetical protein [Jannaschia rubra]CTQ33924.1 hypothetical protein JAN5088_02713 [Jannaschia rubra]SFG76308.1 hypothetical protein SAMN04488517_11426 [Jannaschia rubra]
MDMISELVADALRQARLVRKCLDAKAIPLLDPRHRTFAGDISRRIASRKIVNEAFLHDLEAFIVLVSKEVEAGTTIAWRGHEHDPDCGYEFAIRSDRATAFRILVDEMVDLATMVEAALDAAEAFTIANALFET